VIDPTELTAAFHALDAHQPPPASVTNRMAELIDELVYADFVAAPSELGLAGTAVVLTPTRVVKADFEDSLPGRYQDADGQEWARCSSSVRCWPRRLLMSVSIEPSGPGWNEDGLWTQEWDDFPPGGCVTLRYEGQNDPLSLPLELHTATAAAESKPLNRELLESLLADL
jgi:hypothetical protein